MRLRLLTTLCALLLPLVGGAPAHAQDPDGELVGNALVQALRGGGYIVFFRHAATNLFESDRDANDFSDCERQRNLSEEGRAQARGIGVAWEHMGIPVGLVLSSPYCRTIETALLAFGRAEETRALLLPFGRPDDPANQAEFRRLLGVVPEEGVNTVMVSHSTTLGVNVSFTPDEGEAVVFRPLGDGRFVIVARVPAAEWLILARGAGPPP